MRNDFQALSGYTASGSESPGRPSNGRKTTANPVVALLEVERVSKAFAGVNALSNVDLALDRATVHAIVGHNGAGKSTLMKILGGIVQPDAGRFMLNGKEIVLQDPRRAQEHGISMVHQELSVLEDLDVAENIFLGREPVTWAGFTDRPKLDRMAAELLQRLGLDLPVRAVCSSLSVGERQMVEIARAVSWDAAVVIMDEPTSALSDHEQKALFELIGRLKANGIGILYISHRLDEIIDLADTVTVLRDGVNAGKLKRGEFDHARLIEMMIGRSIEQRSPPKPNTGKTVLEVMDLDSRESGLAGIRFSVAAGEIVGLAGMLGSGRSELFECLFGMRPYESGSVVLDGVPIHPKSPNDAMAKGIGLVPEDRKIQGIFPGTALWKNVTLASFHDRFSTLGFVKQGPARRSAEEAAAQLDIRAHSIDQDISLLSGGNQQKAILARWTMRDPRLLLLDDPSAGIDIGAKTEIHALIRDLASKGVSIMVSSSELSELIDLCHRILIMRDGQIIDQVNGCDATEHSIILSATGGNQ